MRIGTLFSGIGAPEQALPRVYDEHEIVFADISGFPGYSVTSDGRVYSHPKNGTGAKGKFLSATENIHGYLIVGLCNNGKRKYLQVHRIVAMAFIENKDAKQQVNHKDGNTRNNHVSNLEWVTQSENINHAIKSNLKPMRHGKKRGKKYIGVYLKKSTGRYAAIIIHHGERYNIGYFDTEKEAAIAYNKKAFELGIKEYLNEIN